MTKTPSKATEAIVAQLIPPSRREEVLGDLHERYRGTPQYLFDALRTVPHVAASEIRRTTDWRLVLLEALALFMSMLGGEWYARGGHFANGRAEMLALTVPIAIVLSALRLVDAYARPGKRAAFEIVAGVALAISIAAAAEELLSLANPSLALAWAVLVPAGITALVLLSTLRAAMPPRESGFRTATPTGHRSISAQDIEHEAKEFNEKIRRRNRAEYVAAAFVTVFFGFSFFRAPDLAARIGFALIIAGAIYAMYHLWAKGSPGTPPVQGSFETFFNFHRQELLRQRDLLHRIWRWYLGPFLPGGLMLMLGALLSKQARTQGLFPVLAGATVCAAIFVLVWKVNQRAERRPQLQIDELDSLANRQ